MPIPEGIESCIVLDLGCGCGRDACISAKLVGPQGKVIGVDMTEKQWAVARRHVESQTATYLGTIDGNPHSFVLDDHHLFVTGKPMLVCGNTAAMVQQTRFGRHFRVTGDTSAHFGPFD